MKKYFSLLVSLVLCSGILAGCTMFGNNVTEGTTPNTMNETDTKQLASETGLKHTDYKSVNDFDGVTMAVKEGSISPSGLTVIFSNKSKSQCIFGEFYCLEKKISGDWFQVSVTIKGNYAFNSIGYNLDSGKDRELDIKWDWLYGRLDVGEYRIIKDIGDFKGSGKYTTYYLAAGFTIN